MLKEGTKYDNKKLRFELLEPWFEEAVVKVLTKGAMKYADFNWQKVDNAEERYYGALRRHISAWRGGEKNDKETGVSHLAHAACNLFFLMWFDRKAAMEQDDKKHSMKVTLPSGFIAMKLNAKRPAVPLPLYGVNHDWCDK